MLGQELRKLLDHGGYGGRDGQKRFRLYMAEHHGMSVSAEAVSSWLRGDRQPKLAHLVAILDAFAVPSLERERLIRLASGVAAPDTSNRDEAGFEDRPTEGA
jgi:transcriptional regulator with XRE-family HTH domain